MISRIRSLIFYAFISVISVVLVVFVCMPMYFLRTEYKYRYQISVIFSFLFIHLLRFICGIDYQVMGEEKLPDNTAYILMSNHQSFWENFFMQLIIPMHSWVVKKELYDIPVFGAGLRFMEPIAVNRSDAFSIKQIINDGKNYLNQNMPLITFPEGTRIPINSNIKFKSGPSKLAYEANVPVVLMVHNAGIFWPKGFWFKQSGVVTVKILEYISAERVAEYGVRGLTAYVQEVLNKEKDLLVQEYNDSIT